MVYTVTERVPFEPIPFTYEGERATIIVPSKNVVGHGATATVLQGILYAATGVKMVALKVHGAILTDKQRLLLHREMEVWRKVVHPRILPFYGTCDISTNQVALVSPYMDKGNLCKYLADNEDCDRLQIIRQVAEGLHYLHKTGFVHGDIKGENVLVDPDGNAVIADFGLSTPVYSEDAPTATFIRERKTVKFSAPELFIDEAVDYGITLCVRSKTRMSDVFAFGALIYQVYSGSPPWHGLKDSAVLLSVCRGERPDRPPHPHLRDEIWALCLRCWKHIPGDRPFMFFVLLELTALVNQSEEQPALVTLNPDAPEFVPSFLPSAGDIYPRPERPTSALPEAVPNLAPSPITSESDLPMENLPRSAASCSASETMANVLPSASPLFSLNPIARSFTMPPDRDLFGTGDLDQDVHSDPSQSCAAKVEGDLSASASIFIPRFGFLTSPTLADPELVISSSPPRAPEAHLQLPDLEPGAPPRTVTAKVEGNLSASASIFIPRFGFLTSPTLADSESVISFSPPRAPEAHLELPDLELGGPPRTVMSLNPRAAEFIPPTRLKGTAELTVDATLPADANTDIPSTPALTQDNLLASLFVAPRSAMALNPQAPEFIPPSGLRVQEIAEPELPVDASIPDDDDEGMPSTPPLTPDDPLDSPRTPSIPLPTPTTPSSSLNINAKPFLPRFKNPTVVEAPAL